MRFSLEGDILIVEYEVLMNGNVVPVRETWRSN